MAAIRVALSSVLILTVNAVVEIRYPVKTHLYRLGLPEEQQEELSLHIVDSIKSIADESLGEMELLEHLWLENNTLDHLRNGMFKGVEGLRSFRSNGNGITNVHGEAFKGLTKLELVQMTNENLTRIEAGRFSNLTVKTLDLSGNGIGSIDRMAFENCKNLVDLNLNRNRLKTFAPAEFVTYPEKLSKLCLNKNRLRKVTRDMMEPLTALVLLDLGFNKISFIETDSFTENTLLETLIMSQNVLSTIEGTMLPNGGFSKLKRIFLDHNRLMFLETTFLSKVPNLKEITIVGNPWSCACFSLITKWIDDNRITMKCDEEYLKNGKRPFCVVPNSGSGYCGYTYDTALYDRYVNSINGYPLITC